MHLLVGNLYVAGLEDTARVVVVARQAWIVLDDAFGGSCFGCGRAEFGRTAQVHRNIALVVVERVKGLGFQMCLEDVRVPGLEWCIVDAVDVRLEALSAAVVAWPVQWGQVMTGEVLSLQDFGAVVVS